MGTDIEIVVLNPTPHYNMRDPATDTAAAYSFSFVGFLGPCGFFGFLGFRFGLSSTSGSAGGNYYCGNSCGSVDASSGCSVVAGCADSDSLILKYFKMRNE